MKRTITYVQLTNIANQESRDHVEIITIRKQ